MTFSVFESSCYSRFIGILILVPFSNTQETNLSTCSHNIPLLMKIKQGNCEYQFPVLWSEGNKPKFTDCEVDINH